MTDIEKLKAAALAASPGTWKYHKDDNFVHADTINYRMIGVPSSKDVSREQRDANGEFIAIANPAAILNLLAQLDAAKKKEEMYEFVRKLAPRSFTEYQIQSAISGTPFDDLICASIQGENDDAQPDSQEKTE